MEVYLIASYRPLHTRSHYTLSCSDSRLRHLASKARVRLRRVDKTNPKEYITSALTLDPSKNRQLSKEERAKWRVLYSGSTGLRMVNRKVNQTKVLDAEGVKEVTKWMFRVCAETSTLWVFAA